MLAVVTCFFNFGNFKRPQANLHRFLRQMKRDGAKVFGVEAHLKGANTTTKGIANWQQIPIESHNQMLWQKEAAINLAAKAVPSEYTNLAWIDADIWFDNPNWVKDTEQALESCDVVQLFDRAVWTGPDGKTSLSKCSVAETQLDVQWRSHPGFAWAMRRDVWERIGGLFPFAASGAGDTVMAMAFQGSKLPPAFQQNIGVNPARYDAWKSHLYPCVLGHIQGTCYHEWHGTMEDRDYIGRRQRVAKIDSEKDLQIASNGLLAWTESANPKIIGEVRQYFTSKNDDKL